MSGDGADLHLDKESVTKFTKFTKGLNSTNDEPGDLGGATGSVMGKGFSSLAITGMEALPLRPARPPHRETTPHGRRRERGRGDPLHLGRPDPVRTDPPTGHIEDPVASAVVHWRTAEQGGRLSGPPSAPVYMATAVFVLGDDSEVQPGWPASAEQLSILLQKTGELDDGRWEYLVGFLVPELARPHVHAGAELIVLEGPRTVATAQVGAVLPSPEDQ
ncbi:hypothetical protein ACFYWO_34460 [Streptomyces sp. NPDC002932]|uniref:hypothetical protein n=1 Tax=Streptomyces sp. NPDC002932 TaxID=3364672 RepID=UPI00369C13AF